MLIIRAQAGGSGLQAKVQRRRSAKELVDRLAKKQEWILLPRTEGLNRSSPGEYVREEKGTLKVIKGVFNAQDLAAVRALIACGRLQDGAETAFGLARAAKSNQQYVFDQADSQGLADLTFTALKRSSVFHRCALPVEASMPMINRYVPGMCYGPHYDTSLMVCPNGSEMRTDLSATLFISDPADYDGGELCLEMDGAEQKIKLAAGDLMLYPAGILHNVAPVTRGVRHAVVFWVQSRIREHDRREMLCRLDESIGALASKHPECAEVRDLLGVFQNLTRMWMT